MNHFNYQSGDKAQIERILDQGTAEKGVTKIEKVSDELLRIEYDRTLTNMGVLLAAFRGYRTKAEEAEA